MNRGSTSDVSGGEHQACGRGLSVIALALVALTGGRAHAQWSDEVVGGMDTQVYVPEASSPVGSGRALMVVLHGCSQTAAMLRDEGNLEPAADSLGVVMAAPDVPGGGVLAGCWDYDGPSHTRTSGDNGPVLEMVDALLGDVSLSIDPDQVYVVGFSSGGGLALLLGCVAPDVFAGVGAVAAPSVGTEFFQIGSVGTTGGEAAMLCTQLAADQAIALETQAAFSFADSSDFTVSPGYNAVNAEMFGLVYAPGLGALTAEAFDLATLPGIDPAGAGMTYSDAGGVRIAQLDSTAGEAHAWPAGSGRLGGRLSFIDGDGLNLSLFAAELFATHNRRVGRAEPPPGGTGGSTGTAETAASDDESGDTAAADTGGGSSTGNPGVGGSSTIGEASTTGGVATDVAEQGGPDGAGCSVSSHDSRVALSFSALLLFGLRRRRARGLCV